MTTWVLDTDHVSLLQRGHPVVVSKVATVNPSEIAVTVITVIERTRSGSSHNITE